MAFEGLTQRLQQAFGKVRGKKGRFRFPPMR